MLGHFILLVRQERYPTCSLQFARLHTLAIAGCESSSRFEHALRSFQCHRLVPNKRVLKRSGKGDSPTSLASSCPTQPCRSVHEVFPRFSIWGKTKRNALRSLSKAKALQKLRSEGYFVSSYAGTLALRSPNGKTRHKKDVIKDFWNKGLRSVGVLSGKNIWRIFTRSRKPRILLKDDSYDTIVGPGARKFLNVINFRSSSLLADSTSTESANLFSDDIRKAWLTYRRIGTKLVRRFGSGTPEGAACQKHLDDMATTDDFQFINCESIKALQYVPAPPSKWKPPEL